MRKPSDDRRDELLVAYCDDELDVRQRAEVEALLAADPALRAKVARLGESAALVRAAFDETLREPIPEHLIAAARGGAPASTAPDNVVPFRAKPAKPVYLQRRWWVGVAAAASVGGLVIGTGLGYFGRATTEANVKGVAQSSAATTTANWLDNIAGYHKMFVSASAGDRQFVDFPSDGDSGEMIKQISQRISQQGVRVPNLKPWGLNFQGARLLVIEGRPAAQLMYTTENKAIGPLTVVIGSSKRQEVAPTFDQRQDVNLLYWRNKGRAYAIVGQADAGYMWGLANDIAWQLDAI